MVSFGLNRSLLSYPDPDGLHTSIITAESSHLGALMTQSLYLSQQIRPHFTSKEVSRTSISRLFKMGQCHRCDLKDCKKYTSELIDR